MGVGVAEGGGARAGGEGGNSPSRNVRQAIGAKAFRLTNEAHRHADANLLARADGRQLTRRRDRRARAPWDVGLGSVAHLQ